MGLFSSKQKPSGNHLQDISRLVQKNDGIQATESDRQDLSNILVTMKGINQKDSVKDVMSKLFEEASLKITDEHNKEVLNSLKKHIQVVEDDLLDTKPQKLDTIFFPSKEGLTRLLKYIQMAKKTLKICVFTITNNDIRKAIEERHRNKVNVQLITDDECMNNLGSDIQYLANQGILVRTDNSQRNHMHNKFVIIDDTFLITGSFNWTQAAVHNNQENLLIVDHSYYIEKFNTEFQKLWDQFETNEVECKAAETIQKAYRHKKGYYKNKNVNNSKNKNVPQSGNGLFCCI